MQEHFPHPLDDFQREAAEALLEGRSAVVAAPTGSGKTAVAEVAAVLALGAGRRVIYTTPLKALSNQKLRELQGRFGEDRVGLVTGDVQFQPRAEIVVMTTEVLRNILYSQGGEGEGEGDGEGEVGSGRGDGGGAEEADDRLQDVQFIVLDEVHYIGDKDRGSVWEESIIYAPKDIQLVCLSATIANVEELVSWMGDVQGPTVAVSSSERPVPLTFLWARDGGGDRGVQVVPLQGPSGGLNPEAREPPPSEHRARGRTAPSEGGSFDAMLDDFGLVPEPQRFAAPPLDQVVENLRRRSLFPCIYFIFRRAGCDQAAKAAAKRYASEPIVSAEEREHLRAALEELREVQADAVRGDLEKAFLQGFASHHAGNLPGWKALVERCFQAGWIKVVFATDTLAAGINMPARSTVVSELSRLRSRRKRTLMAHNELLQMAGRAGRRGFDTTGTCVLLATPNVRVEQVWSILRRGPEPVDSQFAIGYGMALNLLERRSMREAQRLIQRSFLNYQSMAGPDSGESGEDEQSLLLSEEAIDAARSVEKVKGALAQEEEALKVLIDQAEELRTQAILGVLACQDTLPFTVGLDLSRNSYARGASHLMPGLVLSELHDEGRLLALGADNCYYKLRPCHIAALGPDIDVAQSSIPLAQVQEMGQEAAETLIWASLPHDVQSVAASVVTAGVAATLPPAADMALIGLDSDTDGAIRELRSRVAEAKAREKRALRSYMSVSQRQAAGAPSTQNYQLSVTKWLKARQQTAESRLNVTEHEVPAPLAVAGEGGGGGGGGEGEGGGAAGGGGSSSAWRYTVQDRLTWEEIEGPALARKSAAKQEAFRLAGIRLRKTENLAKSLQEFNSYLATLVDAGCLEPRTFELTSLGQVARAIRGDNELWLAKALTADALYTLSPSELAGVVCALLTSDNVRVKEAHPASLGSEAVIQAVTSLEPAWSDVMELQQTYRVGSEPVIDVRLAGLAEQWAEGASWGELMGACRLDGGDLARLLNRTMDTLNQIWSIPDIPQETRRSAKEAVRNFNRQPIEGV